MKDYSKRLSTIIKEIERDKSILEKRLSSTIFELHRHSINVELNKLKEILKYLKDTEGIIIAIHNQNLCCSYDLENRYDLEGLFYVKNIN